MFDKLTERLQGVMESLRGRGRLTDENIADTLRQVRMALLEADVALPVVKTFIDAMRGKVVGQEIDKSLTPGQTLVRIIHDELIALMGAGVRPLNLRAQPPVVILLAGLQGAGKTTSAAKLAKWLNDNERKKVLLASTDVYRPAAILQLERLAAQLEIGFYPSDPNKSPVVLAREALDEARRSLFDVLIVDTAGRLHVDDEMMGEIREISGAVAPTETLFVVDSMAGQDAVNAARAFGQALNLTGVVLTKTDGDARGGAALVGPPDHRSADPVHGHGREDRRPGAVPGRTSRFAHPRHGRRAGAGGERHAQRRSRAGREAGPQAQEGQGFRSGGPARPAAAGREDGRPERPHGQAARAAGRQGRGGAPGQRQGDPAADRCHPFDDTGRAPLPEDDRRVPQAAYRGRLRRARFGGQPPAQELPADAEGDEGDVEGRRSAPPDGGIRGRRPVCPGCTG